MCVDFTYFPLMIRREYLLITLSITVLIISTILVSLAGNFAFLDVVSSWF